MFDNVFVIIIKNSKYNSKLFVFIPKFLYTVLFFHCLFLLKAEAICFKIKIDDYHCFFWMIAIKKKKALLETKVDVELKFNSVFVGRVDCYFAWEGIRDTI